MHDVTRLRWFTLHSNQALNEKISCYTIFNEYVGEITIREALKHAANDEMFIRSKGKGNNTRYTSCKWKVCRRNLSLRPRDSGGYLVLQVCE